jgi:hypothetical protein
VVHSRNGAFLNILLADGAHFALMLAARITSAHPRCPLTRPAACTQRRATPPTRAGEIGINAHNQPMPICLAAARYRGL